jgi:hypothetical protein
MSLDDTEVIKRGQEGVNCAGQLRPPKVGSRPPQPVG